MQTIGDRLKAERLNAKLTLEQAGAIAGVSKQAISQIERGVTKNPEAATLEALTRRFGVSLQWLMTGKGSRQIPQNPTSDSHKVRPDFSKISDAITVLKSYLEVVGHPAEWVLDPELLEIAYELVDEQGKAVTQSNVIDLTAMLGRRIRAEGVVSDERNDSESNRKVRGPH